jgi:hypothetical protein
MSQVFRQLCGAERPHPGAKTGRSSAINFAWKDQLDAIGSAQVQIVTNDFLEELATPQGAIHNLGQAKFHLPN